MGNLPLISNKDDLKGKRVLLRLGLNVPIVDGKVIDGFRVKAALASIEYLRDRGAKVLILSHVGRRRSDTLLPVTEYIKQFIPLTFIPDVMGEGNSALIDAMADGDVAVFENLRRWDGETANDEGFAKHLASFGDIYVNDAFSVSHRAHASIVGIPKFIPGYAGLHFEKEIQHLSGALHPERPFLFILGGAKVETKLPLMKKFLDIADVVFVGGALANNFFKEEGYEVGDSLVEDENLDLESLIENERLLLPTDVVVENSAGSTERPISQVVADDTIVDVGMGSIGKLEEVVKQSRSILWNGPMGNYEKGYDGGTRKLLEVIAAHDAMSIIGGGDTVALVDEMDFVDKFTFVSTGGGAMLDYLADEDLPGINALVR